MKARLIGIVLGVLLVIPATAQQFASQARGLGGAVAYQPGGVDHVNLFNGQLSVTLPLGASYPVGPGFSYGLGLTYSANPWEHSFQSCITQTGTPAACWVSGSLRQIPFQ